MYTCSYELCKDEAFFRQCNTEQANQQITTTNDGERNIMMLKFDSKLSRDRRSSQNHKFSLQVEAVGGKHILKFVYYLYSVY